MLGLLLCGFNLSRYSKSRVRTENQVWLIFLPLKTPSFEKRFTHVYFYCLQIISHLLSSLQNIVTEILRENSKCRKLLHSVILRISTPVEARMNIGSYIAPNQRLACSDNWGMKTLSLLQVRKIGMKSFQ